MKHFVILSQAYTKLTSSDLQSQGRLDIVLHSIITALFASHTFREDTILDIILMGPPEKPRRVRMRYDENHSLSKKNLKKSIEIALNKCKSKHTENNDLEVLPGVSVCEIEVENYLTALINDSKNFNAILDSSGYFFEHYEKNISLILNNNSTHYENIVFFLGDHEGIGKKLRKFLKKNSNRISLGSQMYFTSQACTILHYEMDKLFEKISFSNQEDLNDE